MGNDCRLLLKWTLGFGIEFGPCGEVDGVFLPPLGGAVSLVCYALHSHELRVVSAEKRDDVEG